VRVGNDRGWHVYFVIPIAVVVMAAVSGLFAGAMRQSRRTRELAEVLD
jgi:integral membrane sensor domain MASE1